MTNWIRNILGLKAPEVDDEKGISGRQITAETREELHKTVQRVLKNMLIESCPCHYPRFRYLVQFKHQNYKAGSVLCPDVNSLIINSSFYDSKFLREAERVTTKVIGDFDSNVIYECEKCGTKYKNIGYQYSINFTFDHFEILNPKYGHDVGAEVVFPIPLYQGLFGFKNKDILKCASDFRLGSSLEFYNYLVAKRN